MKTLFTIILLFIGVTGFCQSIGYFRYDTVIFQKIGGNSEFKLQNATRGVTGGVLTNMGNGRTAFVTPSASVNLANSDLTQTGVSREYAIGTNRQLTFTSQGPSSLFYLDLNGGRFTVEGAFANIEGTDSILLSTNNVNGQITDINSRMTIRKGNVSIEPWQGNLLVDSLLNQYAASSLMLVWDSIGKRMGTRQLSGLSIPINNLTSATDDGTLDVGDNFLTWNFTGLTTNGLSLISSTTGAGNNSILHRVEASGTNAASGRTTLTGLYSNTHAGTGAVNIALQLNATTGATNTALDIANGTIKMNPLTATTILGLDGDKNIKSVALSGLTYDGTTLTASGGSGWGLSGNAVANGNVFGSTNNRSVPILINNTVRHLFDSTGNLQLYTTSANPSLLGSNDVKLSVNGHLQQLESNVVKFYVGQVSGNTRMRLRNSSSVDQIGFDTGGDSWFLGNLGVGTPTPGVALDVVGDMTVNAVSGINLIGVDNILVGTSHVSIAMTESSRLLDIAATNGTTFTDGTVTITDLAGAGGDVFANASGTLIISSDKRLKHNITDFKYGLSSLMKVRPYNYIRNGDKTNTIETGFIAQNIQQAFDGYGVGIGKDGMMTLNTRAILGATVNSVQELYQIIQEQQKQIEELTKLVKSKK